LVNWRKPTRSADIVRVRVLLITMGTAGDVHPFIAVGCALRARGHEPVLVANPIYKTRIVAAGLGFWPLGDEDTHRKLHADPYLVTRRGGPRAVLHRLLIPGIHDTVVALTDALRVFAPDVVLAHHLVLAAPPACERAKIPCAIAALAPLVWLSRHDSITYPLLPIDDLPRFVDRAYRRVIRPLGWLKWDWPINRALVASGMEPARDIAFTSARGGDSVLSASRLAPQAGTPVLALWSRAFRDTQPDDPTDGLICGPARFDPPRFPEGTAEAASERAAVHDLMKWMTRGSSPIVVTFGSSVAHHAASTYDRCAQALAQLGRRGVFLVGTGDARDWGPHIRSANYVPYADILPRAAAVVHHAGIGTLHACLAVGVPQVIIPFANDEFDNAVRARRLGVAHRVPTGFGGVPTLAAIQRSLREALSDLVMPERCRDIARSIRAENGAERAALELEAIVKRSIAARSEAASS
jgi:rhamnosyltransferase subunit B